MKCLITGGCGFLGTNLAIEGMEQGLEIIIFDNLYRIGSSSNLEWLQRKGKFRFVHGDIRNSNDVTRLVREFKPQAVFHLAGQVAMTTSIVNPRLDFEVNVMGTHNLLEALRKHAPDAAIIYSSTNKVYGDLEQYVYAETETRYVCIDKPNGFDEDTPLSFHSPYGCSKGAADQYMLDYARIFGLNTVVFRHSSMYGRRQFVSYDQGWVGWFCQKADEVSKGLLNEPFTISGIGKQVRDVLHSDDAKSLYFMAIGNIDQVKGQVFNVGGGIHNSLSILELLGLLEEMIDIKLNYVLLPRRTSDQRFFVADITRITNRTGWNPKVSYRDGIKQILKSLGDRK